MTDVQPIAAVGPAAASGGTRPEAEIPVPRLLAAKRTSYGGIAVGVTRHASKSTTPASGGLLLRLTRCSGLLDPRVSALKELLRLCHPPLAL